MRMANTEFDDYEACFMERVSEPIGCGIHISEEEGDKLLKNLLICLLNSKDFTQEELMSLDRNSAEYIEEFGLQHLVSGGWTPLKKGA